MTEDMVLTIGAEAIRVIIFLAGPMLIAAMAIGLLVSVLQAVTQINESTLTFIPKMFAVVVVMAVMAPWMLKILQEYAVVMFTSGADLVK
jgi:flagellar biosynthesis protein FliQ